MPEEPTEEIQKREIPEVEKPVEEEVEKPEVGHTHKGGVEDQPQIDHVDLDKLGADDHTQYTKKDGTRAYTGTGAGFRDEDDMSSDDATAPPSQQSVKKFVEDSSLWEIDGSETQLKTADEIDMQSKKIINVTNPVSDQDAATKKYVNDEVEDWVVASDSLQESDDAAASSTSGTYEKKKEIEIDVGGIIRVKFDLGTNQNGITTYGKVYINGVAVGTEQSTLTEWPSTDTFSEDFNVDSGDLVQLYLKTTSTCTCKNFRLYWTASTSKPYIDARQMVALEATVVLFQANAATGDCTDPDNINDNSTASFSDFDGVNEYAEIDFGKVVSIRQFRYYGNASHNEDGTYKIQYYDLVNHAWTDWKTGISTRTASWSTLEVVSSQFTDKVRIIATALDTGITPNKNKPHEFEIYY